MRYLTVLKNTKVKLSVLLVLFAFLIFCGQRNKIAACVALVIAMVTVGAYGEKFPEVFEQEPESYKGENDQLVGDHSTFNPAFKYYRAGNCKCPTCGLEYREHPVIRMPEKRFYGCELFVLCNTDRVKL